MKDVHIVVGVLSIVLFSVAGLWGAWCWWRRRSSRFFWQVLRVAQVTIVVQAALGGVLLAEGKKAPSLHIIYGLLPLAFSFIGERHHPGAAFCPFLQAPEQGISRPVCQRLGTDFQALPAAVVGQKRRSVLVG